MYFGFCKSCYRKNKRSGALMDVPKKMLAPPAPKVRRFLCAKDGLFTQPVSLWDARCPKCGTYLVRLA